MKKNSEICPISEFLAWIKQKGYIWGSDYYGIKKKQLSELYEEYQNEKRHRDN